jgi:hypothetical protein
MLKVARRTPAPYGRVWDACPVIFKALMCSVLVFIALGAAGLWLRRRRGR